MILIPEEMKLRYSSLNKKFKILVRGILLLLSTILNLGPYGQRSSYINQFLPAFVIVPENRGYEKVHFSFFHVELVFPQCRGLMSSLGTPQPDREY